MHEKTFILFNIFFLTLGGLQAHTHGKNIFTQAKNFYQTVLRPKTLTHVTRHGDKYTTALTTGVITKSCYNELKNHKSASLLANKKMTKNVQALATDWEIPNSKDISYIQNPSISISLGFPKRATAAATHTITRTIHGTMDITTPSTPETYMVLAHEMGHIKNHSSEKVITGFGVGIIGTHCLAHILKQSFKRRFTYRASLIRSLAALLFSANYKSLVAISPRIPIQYWEEYGADHHALMNARSKED